MTIGNKLSAFIAMLAFSNAFSEPTVSYEGKTNHVCRVDDGWFYGGPDDPDREDHYRLRYFLSLQECKDKCTEKSWCKGIEHGKSSGSLSRPYCELWRTEIGSMEPKGNQGRLSCYQKEDSNGEANNNQYAYDRGYREARDLWYDMWFDEDDCDVDEVIYDFKPEVEYTVYDECERRYGYNQDFEYDCRDGADAYVAEMHRECTSSEDCTGIGSGFAQDIADDFCDPIMYDAEQSRDKEIFPAGCKEDAIDECESEVANLVDDYAQNDVCGSYDDWYDVPYGIRRDLKDECERVIEEYFDNAELP